MVRVTLRSLTLGCLAVLATGCPEAPDYGQRGAAVVPMPLNEKNHGDYLGQADCRGCHQISTQHDGYFTPSQCAQCHGGNGAPRLDDEHEGWGQADCAECHEVGELHGAVYSPPTCVLCHGVNGAGIQSPPWYPTPLTASHSGWESARCDEMCHPPGIAHDHAYSRTACAGCHGANGGQWRPADHWVTDCNDCHWDGPYAWNPETHAGLEADAPRVCLYCHR